MPTTDTATSYSLTWDALRSPDLPLREPPAAPGERWLVGPDVDLFTAGVTDAQRDRAFAVMDWYFRQTFLLLTERPNRMIPYLSASDLPWRIFSAQRQYIDPEYHENSRFDDEDDCPVALPLRDVLPGVTVRTQADADRLIPELLRVPVGWLGTWVDLRPTEEVDLSRWTTKPAEWLKTCRETGSDYIHSARAGRRGESKANPLVCTDMADRWLESYEAEKRKMLGWLAISDVHGLDLAGVRGAVAQCRGAGVPVWCGPPIDGELIRQWPGEVS